MLMQKQQHQLQQQHQQQQQQFQPHQQHQMQQLHQHQQHQMQQQRLQPSPEKNFRGHHAGGPVSQARAKNCTRCSVDQSAMRERNDAETAPPSAACFSLQMRADHKGKRTSAGTKHSPGREEDVRRPPYRAVLMSSKKEIVHQAHYRGSKRFVIPCGHMCASARHVRWADYGGGQHSHPTWRCRLPAVSCATR